MFIQKSVSSQIFSSYLKMIVNFINVEAIWKLVRFLNLIYILDGKVYDAITELQESIV